jgi:hypothetical protein
MDRKTKMSTLESRWIDDPQYQFILKSFMEPALEPIGMTWREWYATAPKAPHPTLGELLDCRGLNLENSQIGEATFDAVLDSSTLRTCTFNRTVFAHASAANCDFTSSRFIVAQMSPIYAPSTIFKDCVFESCFLMGIGPRHYSKGAFSDLRGCDFTGVQASKTAFNRCDFRGAKLNHAHFVGCEFLEADMRGVDFTGASFEAGEFGSTQLDDTPALRALVRLGNNLELETIQWVPNTRR